MRNVVNFNYLGFPIITEIYVAVIKDKKVKIIFGKTIIARNNNIQFYLENLLHIKDSLILFTVLYDPNDYTQETHYETAVLDTRTNKLYAINSMYNGEEYHQTEILSALYDFVEPFFNEHGIQTIWMTTNRVCQIFNADVYCQTWSLLLQIEMVKMLNTHNGKITTYLIQCYISEKRFDLLLNFYRKNQQLLEQILQVEYKVAVNYYIDQFYDFQNKKNTRFIFNYGKILDKECYSFITFEQLEESRKLLLRENPIKILQLLKYDDLLFEDIDARTLQVK